MSLLIHCGHRPVLLLLLDDRIHTFSPIETFSIKQNLRGEITNFQSNLYCHSTAWLGWLKFNRTHTHTNTWRNKGSNVGRVANGSTAEHRLSAWLVKCVSTVVSLLLSRWRCCQVGKVLKWGWVRKRKKKKLFFIFIWFFLPSINPEVGHNRQDRQLNQEPFNCKSSSWIQIRRRDIFPQSCEYFSGKKKEKCFDRFLHTNQTTYKTLFNPAGHCKIQIKKFCRNVCKCVFSRFIEPSAKIKKRLTEKRL